MKLEFEQTPEHIKDLQNATLKSYKWLRYGLVGMVALIFLNSLWKESLDFNLSIGIILSWVTPMIIIFAIWYFLMKFIFKRSNQTNKKLMLGKRTVEISEEQLFYKTEYSETNFQWNGFSKMVETKLCYLLYMGKQQAVIIPKSAFLNDFDRKEFLGLVESKVG